MDKLESLISKYLDITYPEVIVKITKKGTLLCAMEDDNRIYVKTREIRLQVMSLFSCTGSQVNKILKNWADIRYSQQKKSNVEKLEILFAPGNGGRTSSPYLTTYFK